VSDIAQQQTPTTQSLLSAMQFTFTHSNDVITGISRPEEKVETIEVKKCRQSKIIC